MNHEYLYTIYNNESFAIGFLSPLSILNSGVICGRKHKQIS